MVVSLKKSSTEADDVPYLSLVPMTRTTEIAEQVVAAVTAEPIAADHTAADEQPDRALRQRIILGNAIAWLLIIVAIRLIFF